MDMLATERSHERSTSIGSSEEASGNQQDFLLTIVIPCFNEALTIRRVVDAVLATDIRNKEIIIVDDCSTAGTTELLRNDIEPLVPKVIYHPKNRAKGAALRTGFQHATGDIVLVQDADLEYDPNEYPKLVAPILNHGADVVYRSRLMIGQGHAVL